MLVLNKLYRLIKDKRCQTHASLNVAQFQLQQNSQQKNYAIYELPQKSKIQIKAAEKQYHLQAAHLSFYEYASESEHNPNLSQYHYTAYFEDAKHNFYQVHVYFNQKDKVLNTTLDLRNVDGSFSKQTVDNALKERLTHLAIEQSFELIAELRQQESQFLNTYEDRYKVLEAELTRLSLNLEENLAAYKTILEEIIQVSQELGLYIVQYQALAKLFIHQKALLETETQQKAPSKTTASEMNASSSSSTTKFEKEETKTCLPATPIPVAAELISQAKKAKEHFLGLLQTSKSSLLEEKLPSFLSFNQKVQDLLIVTQDKDYSLTRQEAEEIRELITEATAQAKAMLSSLLLKNEFDAALALRNCTNLLTAKFVVMALKLGNAPLLDYLLTHGDFAVNTLRVDGLAPTAFCLQNHSTKASKLACLSVLIKHHASVLIPAKDGLPLAHHILSEPNHPLRKALMDNAETTVANRHWLTSLHQQVEAQLATSTMDELSKYKILFASQNHYDLHQQTALTRNSTAATAIALRQSNSQLAPLFSFFDQKELKALQEDSEFAAKKTTLNTLYDILLSKLNEKQKRTLGLHAKTFTKNLSQTLQNLGQNFSEVKAEALKALDTFSRIITLRIELVDVQAFLVMAEHQVNPGKKLRKQNNNAYRRQREILDEIKIIGAAYLPFMDDELPQMVAEMPPTLLALSRLLASFVSNLNTQATSSNDRKDTTPAADSGSDSEEVMDHDTMLMEAFKDLKEEETAEKQKQFKHS